MRDRFCNAQQIRKPAVSANDGIAAAQSSKAAEVGAEVLAAGVDAVIATTFVLGVLEPWMGRSAARCRATVPQIATFTGHSSEDVEAILDARYLGRDAQLAEAAVLKREERKKL